MKYAVRLSGEAERDLEEIDDYISEYDSPSKALAVVGKIEAAIASLAESPARGAYVVEEAAHGTRNHREIFYKPYRIVYRVMDRIVTVTLIADGRRDLEELLQRRLSSP